MSFSESICKESEDVDVDVDVDVPPHVQELVATDNSRFEDWVMQVKAFRVRWFGSSDMVTMVTMVTIRHFGHEKETGTS